MKPIAALSILGGLLFNILCVKGDEVPNPSCDSPIYCPGPLLHTIQLARLYPDSKTFVDKPTSKPLSEVLAAFAALPANATSKQLQSFVNSTFLPEGQELVPAELTDFVTNPQFLTNISDKFLSGWANEVHGYWPNLTRKVNETFLCEGCVTSLLSLNRSFVVPGGRFREIYYWDSFFVIEGLLLSELYETSKNMILNFLDFVDKYGFVPNGARIYYLNRSQPPFLVQMVKSYFLRTHDTDLLTRALPTLDAEYAFWQRNTTVDVFDPSTGHTYRLNRYNVDNASPRPESYIEDYTTATNGTNLNATAQAELYADLATGAETGWDYSSRWISEEVVASAGQDQQRLLRGLRTRQIVPVDLNSILYANEVAMAQFHAVEGGDLARSKWYKRQAKERVEAMGEVLWDEKAGGFFDWDMGKGGRRTTFTVSNYFPFWADAIPEKIASNPEKLINTFADIDRLLQEYPGLIPTTEVNTGLQWDLPDGWPPLQYILVKALTHTSRLLEGLTPAQSNSRYVTPAQRLLSMAREVAQRFVSSAFCAWVQTGGSIPDILPKRVGATDAGHMFEKYNVSNVGLPGGGGEYTVQAGFGWTNGVALWTLNEYGATLVAPPACTNASAH